MKDSIPGDLQIRMCFARVYGTGLDSGQIKPTLEITDGTSGKNLVIELAAEEVAEMLSGSQLRIPADRVNGFAALHDFGKYHHVMTVNVAVEAGDYDKEPRTLPHVAKAMEEIEGAGYRCDTPRRNNQRQWVIVGRKYTETP